MKLTYKHGTARLSHVVIAGDMAYIAGQLPDPDCEPDVSVQAKAVLAKIEKLLADAGSARDHIVMANVYLADLDDFATFNEVWDAWTVEGRAPARLCLQSRLVRPEWKVEIAVVAALCA